MEESNLGAEDGYCESTKGQHLLSLIFALDDNEGYGYGLFFFGLLLQIILCLADNEIFFTI